MFKSVNVFHMVVLVLILVGVVMIFMRQNNTCVMKNDDVIEEAHFPGKKMLNTMKAKAAERATEPIPDFDDLLAQIFDSLKKVLV